MHFYKNGDVYEGSYTNDKRIGKGKIIFADGSQLISQFIGDAADGHAIYENTLGNTY